MNDADPVPAGEPPDLERVQALLWGALQQPAEQREAWLAAQPAHPSERAEALALASHHDEAGERFLRPVVDRPTESGERLLARAAGRLPERIGPYRVVRRLGSGGMGTVYEAEQDNPRRTVALKVMDRSHASPTAHLRFSLEAQALARLRHPVIAQVYAASADDGDPEGPWFAMEFVPGALPLTRHCRERGLDRTARLRLFAEVCDAVHHGHQRGVIHRDLKPANVLVTAEGRPKIIDFGVARLADPGPGGSAPTLAGQVLGTLGSMAPEQLDHRAGDVDTRSDVYALGALLYELLADRPAFDLADLGVAEAARLVAETDPPPLSHHDRRLSGDLSVIAATAMARQPERRYPSAEALAGDVRRFLGCRPLAARGPSLGYLLGRFAARNRLAVGASVLVAASLVAALTVSLRFAWRAEEQARAAELAGAEAQAARAAAEAALVEATHAREAESAQRRLAQHAEAEALASRDRERLQREAADRASLDARAAQAGSDRDSQRLAATLKFLLEDVFRGPLEAWESAGQDRSIREALELSAAGLDAVEDPWIEAELRSFFGRVYLALGHPEPAAAHLRRARGLLDHGGEDDDDLLASTLEGLAGAEQLLGNYAESRRLHEELLASLERAGLGGTPREAAALAAHATLLRDLDDVEGALAALRRAESILASAQPPERDALDSVRTSLATLLRLRGEPAAAAALLEQVLVSQLDRRPVAEETVARVGTELGSCYGHLGRFAEAEALQREALAIRRRVLEPGHPSIAHGLVGLAVLRHHQQDAAGAVGLLAEAAAIYRARLGAGHAYLPSTLVSLGAAQISAGDPAAALPALHEALEILDASGAAGHTDAINGRSHLGEALRLLGREDEARAQFEAARVALEAHAGPIDPTIPRVLDERLARLAPPD